MSTPSLALALPRRAAPASRWPRISVESFALLLAVYFSLSANTVVWQRVLAGRSVADPHTWLFAACAFVGLTALQFAFIALVLTRRTARVTALLLLAAAGSAAYFAERYAVFIDAGMLRNVVHTNVKEARELFTAGLAWRLAWSVALPALLLWRLPLKRHGWRRATLQRVAAVLGALAVLAVAMLLVFQDLAAVARNRRELRFQVAPANVVYALAKVGASEGRAVAKPLEPIGTDAKLGASWAQRPRPVLLVVVVGETARAASWGLSGYARQTTPELAQVPDLINFADVRSCGTNTEVSLPCLFAPRGRRDYDEARIRGQQGLLHVLDHAGLPVLWRDNQSGCKSACPGLPQERLDAAKVPGLCGPQGCLDGVLLEGLAARLDPQRSQVVVLHMHGSHGPAYSARYPREFARFQPECRSAELRECTPQEVVNAYDNTLLYTDHVLAQTIAFLRAQQQRFDTALVYVSDHGESLGENGLYLHGMPWSIAPREQTQVPMLLWLSPGYARSFALDTPCLRERAARPVSHDHFFHTVLGLLDVRTALHEPALDLAAGCRSAG